MGTQSRASRRNDPRQRAREGADALAGARRPPSGNIGSTPRRSSATSSGATASAFRSGTARDGSVASGARGTVADAEATAARRERAAAAASRARHRRRVRIAVTAVVAALLLVVAAVVGGFAWLRWFSGDDSADIQGTWYLAGTATPIEITEDRINLTDDVSYRYALNPTDKTIAFTFTNLAGSGCYRFSLDRQELALVDGTFTGFDTLGRDIGWIVEALVKKLQGGQLSPGEAGTEGLTLLSRTPAPGASTAKPDADAGAAATGKGKAGDEKTQTIEDEPVGDLSGKLPADINEPRDKKADGTASDGGAASAGAASDRTASSAKEDQASGEKASGKKEADGGASAAESTRASAESQGR